MDATGHCEVRTPPCGTIWPLYTQRVSEAKREQSMTTEFQYDVFLSHSSKDKAVRPLAERLRKDGLKRVVR